MLLTGESAENCFWKDCLYDSFSALLEWFYQSLGTQCKSH